MAVSSTERFAHDTAAAFGAADPVRAASEAMHRALSSGDLFDGISEVSSGALEFHLLRSEEAAIKVFVMSPAQPKSPPHDHGGLWGLYGTYRGLLRMSFFHRRADEGSLEEAESVTVRPGEIQFVPSTVVHAVWTDVPDTLVLTTYNGDLNSRPRQIFDTATAAVVSEISDWDRRLKAGQGLRYEVVRPE